MWRSKKSALITIFLAGALLTSTMVIGCSPTVEKQEPDITVPAGPRSEMGEMPFVRVAEILGIEQEVLEDAFVQARSEIQEIPLEERSLDSLMNRVAEILGIEQQELEETLAQVRSKMPADAWGQRQFDDDSQPWDFKDGPMP